MPDQERVKPSRMVCGQPVFSLRAGEYLLTTHAMKQAVSRGMTIHDLLLAIQEPESIERPGPKSRYYNERTIRYVRDGMAVVVDYAAPVKVVVTVLFRSLDHWDEWMLSQGRAPRSRRT